MYEGYRDGMRILHVTSSYLPHRSGVTIAIEGWVRALRAAGHHVSIWTVGTGDEDAGVFASPGFGAISDGFPLPLSIRAPKPVREQEWDVVHTHHPLLIGQGAVRFARSRGAILAATAHSDYLAYLDAYFPPFAWILQPLVRWRIRRIFDACDVIFAPSVSIERALESWGVAEKVVPATYPVDASALCRASRAEARRELDLPPDLPLALYAGRLAAEKRVLELLEEFRHTLTAAPDARLVIAGDGPIGARVRRAAQAFGDSVVLTGELSADRLGAWYSAADVFVSASLNEVGPLVSIEAGLCGTPTVARRAPGFEDRIEDGVTGLLVGRGAGELGQAVAHLLVNRDIARRLGDAARLSFAEHSPSASAKLMAEAYLSAERRWPQRTPGRRNRRRLEVGTD